MAFIKFTSVKLIPHILLLFCILSLMIPLQSKGSQQYAVQIAAAVTPLDINKFSAKHKIKYPIIEIKSNNWYRYTIGNFNNFDSALTFAHKLSTLTGILNVFPRKIDISYQKHDLITTTKSKLLTTETASTNNSPDSSLHQKAISAGTNVQTFHKTTNEKNDIFLYLVGKKKFNALYEGLVKYGNDHLPEFLKKYYFGLIEKTYTYPIILLFIFLILVFVLNIAVVLVVLYFSNQQKNHKERYVRIFTKMYENVLRSYLFGEYSWEMAKIKLKKTNIALNRKILTSVLLNFQENLRGEMDTQIPEIFVRLRLHEDSLKLSRSSFFHKKVEGLRELTNLYPDGASKIIQENINHKNELIRAEAQISFIRLNPLNPFDFFRKITRPLTRWTQLSAFHLFRLHHISIPLFIEYIDSDHPSVRNFSLRMIIYYQQLENIAEILRFTDDQNELTRYLTIRAINDLRLFKAKEILKNRYQLETPKNQLEIIKAFKNIGGDDDYNFLENIIRSGTITVRTEACRSMYCISNVTREKLIQLSSEPDLGISHYIAHVTDQRN